MHGPPAGIEKSSHAVDGVAPCEQEQGLRALEKYLEGLPEIRSIQDSILERARRCDVPVIENTSLDDAVGEVLDIVLTSAESLARVS